jgi:hypothetical protein
MTNGALLPTDLGDQKVALRRAHALAVLATGDLLQRIAHLEKRIEGEVEDYKLQNEMLQFLTGVEKNAVDVAELAHELIAQHQALLTLARELLDQRDAAQARLDTLTTDLVADVARTLYCEPDQAERLLTALTGAGWIDDPPADADALLDEIASRLHWLEEV